MSLSTERIASAIREILEAEARSAKRLPGLSAAQILERLPCGLRCAMIAEYASPRGARGHFTAEMRIAQVACGLQGVTREIGANDPPGKTGSCRYGIPGTQLMKGLFRVVM